MVGKYVLPLVAVAGLAFALYAVNESRKSPPAARPLLPPPQAPEFDHITGIGTVESRQRNVPIGTQVPGVVAEVFVLNREGSHVEPGDPLFRIDDRQLRAELRVREAQLASAEANHARLQAAPRAEDLPPAEAAVEEMQARVLNAGVQARRSGSLVDRGVGPNSDFDRDRYAAREAEAALRKAQAELARLKKGTWDRDLAISQAAVQEARAELERVRTDLERLTVRAQTSGEILQVNVLPGQYAALAWKEPLIVLANDRDLNIRVEIDESYVPYLKPGSRAFAILRSRPGAKFPLEFVRIDPYVIPKRNLMGDNTEKVDTRVIQAVFAVERPIPIPLYVGQVMDVYVQAVRPEGIDLDPRSMPAEEIASGFDEVRLGREAPRETEPGRSPGFGPDSRPELADPAVTSPLR